jgi:hypothetical protein
MTREDVLDGNRDLFEHAGELLKELPIHRVDFEVETMADGDLKLTVHAANVDRVDVWIDGRPSGSIDVTTAVTTHRAHPPTSSPHVVELHRQREPLLLAGLALAFPTGVAAAAGQGERHCRTEGSATAQGVRLGHGAPFPCVLD